MKMHVVSNLFLASPELCVPAIATTAFFGLQVIWMREQRGIFFTALLSPLNPLGACSHPSNFPVPFLCKSSTFPKSDE